MNALVRRIWGGAVTFAGRTRGLVWGDLVLVLGLAGLIFGVLRLAGEWSGPLRPAVVIDLSPMALPRYAFYSLVRGLMAYLLSLLFSLGYGYWAARDRRAERILLPLLDVLQSVPVLGFLPGFVLALVALFPHSNTGLELAAVLMIFTGQAWNLTFSFYSSLKAVPLDQDEAATVYRFTAWQRFRWVELPFATLALVWNSMMSVAGGWFFLMVSEAFVLGDQDFRLPGIGAYMSVALSRGDVRAMVFAVLAMTLLIVVLDQFLWRPVVAWAQKFRVEEGAAEEAPTSWFLDLLRRSRLVDAAREGMVSLAERLAEIQARTRAGRPERRVRGAPGVLGLIPLGLLLAALGFGVIKLIGLLHGVGLSQWAAIGSASGLTLLRVLGATLLGTLWALPAGLYIGLKPRVSRAVQPVVQIVASFPAPMLFPAAIFLLDRARVPLGWGAIVLMLLGTQWYILFNVIAGAMAIPADLREAARSYRINGFERFRRVYLPAVFPYLVTGWVTAAGGAWNASIVAEYVSFEGRTLTAHGVGALISQSAERADFAALVASVVVLSTLVVTFNRLVWRRMYAATEGHTLPR